MKKTLRTEIRRRKKPDFTRIALLSFGLQQHMNCMSYLC